MSMAGKVEDLEYRVRELQIRNAELNLALMRKSAEASEAKEELKRIRLEWQILIDQKGHNMCHKSIAIALKATLGHTGNYPDPDNVTGEEFAHGCVSYHKHIFPGCRHGLKVVEREEVK